MPIRSSATGGNLIVVLGTFRNEEDFITKSAPSSPVPLIRYSGRLGCFI